MGRSWHGRKVKVVAWHTTPASARCVGGFGSGLFAVYRFVETHVKSTALEEHAIQCNVLHFCWQVLQLPLPQVVVADLDQRMLSSKVAWAERFKSHHKTKAGV